MVEYKFTDDEFHKKVIDNYPLTCCDVLVLNQNRYLIIKREKKPVPVFWFPGGRLMWNETFEDAAIRICKNECGLEVVPKRNLGTESTFFEDGPNDSPIHTVNTIILVESKNIDVTLDSNHSDFKWISIDHVPDYLHPYLKTFLHVAFLEG